jgi:Peptide-N-glycosidase F, C terminal
MVGSKDLKENVMKVLWCAGTMILVLMGCSDDGALPDAATPDASTADAAIPDLAAPHTITLFDRVRINSKGTVNVRQVDTDFAFDTGPYAKVTLEAQLDTSCFPFDKAAAPPPGENWPADCDAFDRNYSFIMDPAADAADPPGFEWVRAITPFGGPLSYTVDLTDLANARPGKRTARVSISTYSDAKGLVSGSNGGWWVTAKLKLEPGTPPRKVLAAVSLFNHSYKHDSGKQQVDVVVPAGTTSALVEYRVTGHGGTQTTDKACIGPAEEFCQRWHKISVDGKELQKLAPWRKDCDMLCTLTTYKTLTYCKENPCGAISSVKAPRANWCPGSVTPPITFKPTDLTKAGKHSFAYEIEGMAQGGSWRVSATYYAFGD